VTDRRATAKIRRNLGLSQREADLIIGGGPNVFQKNESGEILASHAISSAWRLLDAHPDAPALLVAHRSEQSAA
jgi:HTH-type transcriptional regulator/antitoxin MqsA